MYFFNPIVTAENSSGITASWQPVLVVLLSQIFWTDWILAVIYRGQTKVENEQVLYVKLLASFAGFTKRGGKNSVTNSHEIWQQKKRLEIFVVHADGVMETCPSECLPHPERRVTLPSPWFYGKRVAVWANSILKLKVEKQ